jgi:hypothetical protein
MVETDSREKWKVFPYHENCALTKKISPRILSELLQDSPTPTLPYNSIDRIVFPIK